MFFGLGKRATKLGKFLEKHDILQQELAEQAGVSKSTISRLLQGETFAPTMKTALKIIKALRKYDSNVDYEDFWSM